MGLHTLAAAAVIAQWLANSPGSWPVELVAAGIALFLALASVLLGLPRPRRLTVVAAAVIAAVSAQRTAAVRHVPEEPGHVASLLAGAEQSASAVRLRGFIAEPPFARSRGLVLLVECAELLAPGAGPIHGRVALSVQHPGQSWEAGDSIVFETRLRRIRNFGNPGEFDWAGWNARRGVHVSGFAWDDRDLLRGAAAGPERSRDRVRVRLTRAILAAERAPLQARALLAALVTGDRRALLPETNDSMRASGLAHTLSISGMHMGLVGGAIFWLVLRLCLPTRLVRAGFDTYRLAAPCAMVGLLGYGAISGGGVAVARSLLMSLLVLIVLTVGRRANAGLALSAAALCLTLAEPDIACDVGFQLSFAAVAGLLAQHRSMAALGRLRPRPVAWVVSALWLSIVAAAVTAPLTAQHFHRVSWIAPLANLLAAVPVAVTVTLGLAAAALHWVLPAASVLGFEGAAWAAEVVLRIATVMSRLPAAESSLAAPGWLLTGALTTLMLASALPAGARRRLRVILAALSAALVVDAWHARFRADRLDVVFVSVGQGDATIVRLPGGRVVVSDAGPPGRGRLAVAPYLRRLRVGRIDYLVASHVQDDHWGGLPELAEQFDIGEFWHPGGSCAVPRFAEFTETLTRRGVRVIDAGREHERGWPLRRAGEEGWSVEALWPADAVGSCAANDRSVVLAIRFAGRALLLTGDIEASAEQALSRSGDVRADILKVPHHGSATSSTPAFIAAVGAAAAVASVGQGNRYGFPRAEVEERYRARGTAFFRTDRDGAVIATLEATGIAVHAAKRR